MIKFFRNIRRRLLRENRFTRYLIYALGEIILVVIGILIALQIDEYYNKKQIEKKFASILIQMQNEILADMEESQNINRDFLQDLPVFENIAEGHMNLEYIQSVGLLPIHYYDQFFTNKSSQTRYIANIELVPQSFAELSKKIVNLHDVGDRYLYHSNLDFKDAVINFNSRMLQVEPNYMNWMRGKNLEGYAQFISQYPMLQNETGMYQVHRTRLANYSNIYRELSLEIYNEIDSLLGKRQSEPNEIIKSLQANESVIKPWLGRYKGTSADLELVFIDSTFYVNDGRRNGLMLRQNDSIYFHGRRIYHLKQSSDDQPILNAYSVFGTEEWRKIESYND